MGQPSFVILDSEGTAAISLPLVLWGFDGMSYLATNFSHFWFQNHNMFGQVSISRGVGELKASINVLVHAVSDMVVDTIINIWYACQNLA